MINKFEIEKEFFKNIAASVGDKPIKLLKPDCYIKHVISGVKTNEGLDKLGITNIEKEDIVLLLCGE